MVTFYHPTRVFVGLIRSPNKLCHCGGQKKKMQILCAIKKQHKRHIQCFLVLHRVITFFGIRVVITHTYHSFIKPRFTESTYLICPKIFSLMQHNEEIDFFFFYNLESQHSF